MSLFSHGKIGGCAFFNYSQYNLAFLFSHSRRPYHLNTCLTYLLRWERVPPAPHRSPRANFIWNQVLISKQNLIFKSKFSRQKRKKIQAYNKNTVFNFHENKMKPFCEFSSSIRIIFDTQSKTFISNSLN